VYKLWGGAFAGRLASNELGAFVGVLPRSNSCTPNLLVENYVGGATPVFTLVSATDFFFEGAPSVLDQE
jgi:hypothetical protein